MKIAVCIKQVPGTKDVDIDPKTGVLMRSGVRSKMNPYDLFAIETAMRLKTRMCAEVTALTMGPPQAESVIREAYMMGVDNGYILTDRKFAGSDVLATSYTLAEGLAKLGEFQLIICGKQTTDGDTAQVGPAMAEHLGIPHVSWVSKIVEIDESGIVVEQNMEESYEVVRIEYPCLITVDKDIYTPRLPSYVEMKKTGERPVNVLNYSSFDGKGSERFGLSGSPTQVEKVFRPENNPERVVWEGNDSENTEKLFNLLKEKKFI